MMVFLLQIPDKFFSPLVILQLLTRAIVEIRAKDKVMCRNCSYYIIAQILKLSELSLFADYVAPYNIMNQNTVN